MRLLGLIVALTAFALASAGAHADSGSITDVHDAGGGSLAATFTATIDPCSQVYCGGFPFASQVPDTAACSPTAGLVYVGTVQGPGTQTASESFFAQYDPVRLCLYVEHVGVDELVAQTTYASPPPAPPPFTFGVTAQGRQLLRAPGLTKFNNLLVTLLCSRDCSVRLRGTPRYRLAGRLLMLHGLGLDESFRLHGGERTRYGFHFTTAERGRLARVMRRHGPVQWTLQMTASAATGERASATRTIRMTSPAPPASAPAPSPAPPAPTPRPACDPSYPTVCIPSPPPDLDCGEIPYRDFAVVGSDPHGFDGDDDGIGCES